MIKSYGWRVWFVVLDVVPAAEVGIIVKEILLRRPGYRGQNTAHLVATVAIFLRCNAHDGNAGIAIDRGKGDARSARVTAAIKPLRGFVTSEAYGAVPGSPRRAVVVFQVGVVDFTHLQSNGVLLRDCPVGRLAPAKQPDLIRVASARQADVPGAGAEKFIELNNGQVESAVIFRPSRVVAVLPSGVGVDVSGADELVSVGDRLGARGPGQLILVDDHVTFMAISHVCSRQHTLAVAEDDAGAVTVLTGDGGAVLDDADGVLGICARHGACVVDGGGCIDETGQDRRALEVHAGGRYCKIRTVRQMTVLEYNDVARH